MNNSYNYKSNYIGTPRDLEETTSIVLTQSSRFDISVETLKDLPKDLIEFGRYEGVEVSHRGDKDFFNVYLSGDKLFDFDVILYHSQVSGFIGYTIFSGLQHCYSSSGIPFKVLRISLVFNRVEGEGTGVPIGLKVYIDPQTTNKKIIGEEERYQFPELEFFEEKYEDEKNYLRFTNRPQDFSLDRELFILTDSGVITHSKGFSGLYIISGVDIDLSSFPTCTKPIFYKGDLGLLKYSDRTKEFCVSSLTTLNSFGRPFDYLSGFLAGKPDQIILGELNFLGGTSDALLFRNESNDFVVYPLENPEEPIIYPRLEEGKRTCVVLDPWSYSGEVRYITEFEIRKEIARDCITPKNFTDQYSDNNYFFSEKIGSWWKFLTSHGYLYLSVYGMIESQVELNFVNSRVALYFKDGDYHFLPIEFGCSLKYPFSREEEYIINPGTPMSSLDIELRYFLNGLRRKPLRTQGCLPRIVDFIGCGAGVILYKYDGLLYCY